MINIDMISADEAAIKSIVSMRGINWEKYNDDIGSILLAINDGIEAATKEGIFGFEYKISAKDYPQYAERLWALIIPVRRYLEQIGYSTKLINKSVFGGIGLGEVRERAFVIVIGWNRD